MDDYLKYRDKSRDRGERDRDREETGRSVTSLIENFEKEERIRSASRERKYDRDVGMRENGYNGSSPYSYLKDGGGGRNRDGLRDRDHLLLLGRNDPVKNHSMAIEIATKLRLQRPDLVLSMTGVEKSTKPFIKSRLVRDLKIWRNSLP